MSADEVLVPTPARGQEWHSDAFAPGDDDGRIRVLGTVEDHHFGLIIVYHLVRGGNQPSAETVEQFLSRRTYRGPDPFSFRVVAAGSLSEGPQPSQETTG